MALTTQPYKGTRDFYPDEKRTQNYIFGVMRSVSERFGYEEYDAPILEPIELYQAKSGAEIVSEQTYLFTDRGGRQVAIRPEMTPTVSRMVAGRRQELGAGQAQDGCFFASQGYEVTATDIEDTALDLAKQKAADKAVEVDLRKVDLREELPFESECFDVVYAHLSLLKIGAFIY